MSDTRWLDPEKTAVYLSVRIDALPRLVRLGRIPKPAYPLGPRHPRWDRLALDAVFVREAASTDARNAVRAHVDKIIAQGRARREAHARRRLD